MYMYEAIEEERIIPSTCQANPHVCEPETNNTGLSTAGTSQKGKIERCMYSLYSNWLYNHTGTPATQNKLKKNSLYCLQYETATSSMPVSK